MKKVVHFEVHFVILYSKTELLTYRPFDFPFNFAITNLVMAEYLERPQRGLVVLTPKGRSFQW